LFCTNTFSVESFPPFPCLSKLARLATNVSCNKCIKLLDANPGVERERMALKHLKRYIRSLDGQGPKVFSFFDRE